MTAPGTAPPTLPLGFAAAAGVVRHGRAAFFGSSESDLPQDRSPLVAADDRVPQFGYVGALYETTRVLMLGINPGNGHGRVPNAGDEQVMPPLKRFMEDPSPARFVETQRAYEKVCSGWPMWRRHCSEVIGSGRLRMDEVAFSNCLPWRTASKSAFLDSVAIRACELYAYPLIGELQPRLIIALGKRAAEILRIGGQRFGELIVWNRAQAATAAVRAERAATANRILEAVGRGG